MGSLYPKSKTNISHSDFLDVGHKEEKINADFLLLFSGLFDSKSRITTGHKSQLLRFVEVNPNAKQELVTLLKSILGDAESQNRDRLFLNILTIISNGKFEHYEQIYSTLLKNKPADVREYAIKNYRSFAVECGFSDSEYILLNLLSLDNNILFKPVLLDNFAKLKKNRPEVIEGIMNQFRSEPAGLPRLNWLKRAISDN